VNVVIERDKVKRLTSVSTGRGEQGMNFSSVVTSKSRLRSNSFSLAAPVKLGVSSAQEKVLMVNPINVYQQRHKHRHEQNE
jgi:hypothetical protein